MADDLVRKFRFSKAEWRRILSAAARSNLNPQAFVKTATARVANKILDRARGTEM
jgi:hypothetical protein